MLPTQVKGTLQWAEKYDMAILKCYGIYSRSKTEKLCQCDTAPISAHQCVQLINNQPCQYII